ncbi:IS3 family transposase [Thiocystis violacea]|uniref:IS3 family transposase n=1 Tax=Thiocystis violacea TaxID=13725 RepID=UPI001903364B
MDDFAEAWGCSCGSRRMARALPSVGCRVSRHQLRRSMRQAGIQVRFCTRRHAPFQGAAHR